MKQSRPSLNAERMNDLMRKRGISQSELGRRLGKPQGSIQSICAGGVKRPTILKEIAEELGTSQDYLLGLIDDPEPPQSEAEFLSLFRKLSPRAQAAVRGLAASLQELPPERAPPASRRR